MKYCSVYRKIGYYQSIRINVIIRSPILRIMSRRTFDWFRRIIKAGDKYGCNHSIYVAQCGQILKTARYCKNAPIKNANSFQFTSTLNFHFAGQCGGFNYVYYVCRNDCIHCRRNGWRTSHVNDICLRTYVEVSRTSFTNTQLEAAYATLYGV